MRLAVLSGLALWAGCGLWLSQVRWFARASLANRLRPYAPGGMTPKSRALLPSVESFREIVRPFCRVLGERVARGLGVGEDLAVRLERIHSPLDVTAFRVRQLGWSDFGFVAGALLSLALAPPILLGLLLIFGGPALAFLISNNGRHRRPMRGSDVSSSSCQ